MRCAQCPGPRLLPEARLLWSAFQSVETQWRYAACGFGAVATGLDYAGVTAGLQVFHGELLGAGIDDVTFGDLFEGVQIVELAQLEIAAERNAQRKSEGEG